MVGLLAWGEVREGNGVYRQLWLCSNERNKERGKKEDMIYE
jgi:hypothetical protein